MTYVRLRGPAKSRPCSCGKVNRTHKGKCSACQYQEETASLGVFKCALCGKDIARDRMLISPYCSLECSDGVSAIRARVGAMVKTAVKLGQLQKLDGSIRCVDCGKPASQYEHRDYTKPLDVVPVCRSCNHKRGPADVIRAPEQAAA